LVLKSEISSGGLSRSWNLSPSWSQAKADFTLDIESIGLSGYKFAATISLSVKIIKVIALNSTHNEIAAVVKSEGGNSVSNLNKNNFRIDNAKITSISPFSDQVNYFCLPNRISRITVAPTRGLGSERHAGGCETCLEKSITLFESENSRQSAYLCRSNQYNS